MGKFHDFLWETDKPEFTLRTSYLIPESALRVYRGLAFFLAAFIYFWTIESVVSSLPYLTDWGIIFVGSYFLCSSLCYFIYKGEEDVDVKKPVSFWKFVVILCEITFSVEVLIPIYYWALLYPDSPGDQEGIYFVKTVLEHAVTPALIYIEMAFGGVRFYKRHVFFIILVGLFYILCNYIATVVRGEPVYDNLTWEDITTFYFLLAAVGLSLFGFVVGLGISKLKTKRTNEVGGRYTNL